MHTRGDEDSYIGTEFPLLFVGRNDPMVPARNQLTGIKYFFYLNTGSNDLLTTNCASLS